MTAYIPKNLSAGIYIEKSRYVVVKLKHGTERFFEQVGAVDVPNIFKIAETVRSRKLEEWRTGKHNLSAEKKPMAIERAADLVWEHHLQHLSTPVNYRKYLSSIKAEFAFRPIHTITVKDVEAYIRKLMGSYKSTTVNRYRMCLSGIFTCLDEWQVRDEVPELRTALLPARNPCRYLDERLKRDLSEEASIRKVVLSSEEFERFMIAAPTRLRRLMLGAVHSLLRPSDLRTLTKDHIDYDRNIFVGLQKKSGRKYEPPITPAMWELIKTASGDKIFDVTNFQKEFNAARKRAEMPHVQFRDLRRTGARKMLKGGADIDTVRAYLGHGDLNTTRRYVGAANEDLQEASKILDDMYKWPSTPEAPPCSNCGRERGPEVLTNPERLCAFCISGFKAATVRAEKKAEKSSGKSSGKSSEALEPEIAEMVDVQSLLCKNKAPEQTLAQETLNLLVMVRIHVRQIF